MKSKKNLFFLIFIFIIIALNSEEKMVIRFANPDGALIREFRNSQYDVASFKPEEYLDLVVTATEYQNLIDHGYDPTITQTEEQLKTNLNSSRDLAGYRTYDEVYNELLLISYLYPAICELHNLGDSWGKIYFEAGNDNYSNYNQEIWGLKVSDNVTVEEDEPSIYFFGAHHAREPISTEVTMTILNHIVENYGTDPVITDNVDNTQIWFVPVVNPNGHRIVTDEMDIWWRKNIRDNNENGILDEENNYGYPDGVDPNRNYSFQWGSVGTSDSWESQVYHGPEPLSEPENQIIAQLFDTHHFVAGISYHSYGELVLHPYGYNENISAPDHDALSELCINMAEQIPSLVYGNYTPQESWELYACMGTLDDFAYGSKGIFAYTIELATQFIPPAYQVEQVCNDNLDAALTLLNRPNYALLKGHITSEVSREPLVATVFIDGIDDTGEFREPYQSNQQFGSYYRLLTPGNYTVTFSAYGYGSITQENVQISPTEPTILDATLNPVPFTSLSGTVYDAETSEPLEGCRIEILYSPLETFYSDETGAYEFPEIPVGEYQIALSAAGYSALLENIELSEDENIIDFYLEISDIESFENGELGDEWYTYGNSEWFIDDSEAYEGFYSARSGMIGDNQTSTLSISLNVISPGYISFFKKVSCEDDPTHNNYDYLSFLIDDVEIERWDGEIEWSQEVYNVTLGQHTFQWRYQKDGYVSSGSDCAWIDYIDLPEYDNTSTNNTEIPFQSMLLNNYPNPFNPTTTIEYFLAQPGKVRIDIFNIKGELVKTFKEEFLPAGNQKVIWQGEDNNGRDVSSGIYIGMMKQADRSNCLKLVLIK